MHHIDYCFYVGYEDGPIQNFEGSIFSRLAQEATDQGVKTRIVGLWISDA